MKFQEVTITPKQAKFWLDSSNVGNRKKRPAHIKRLASMMSNGEWRTTAQGIVFDVNNNLLDGQHRLEAIVLSGVSVRMVVCTGADPGDFITFDSGVKRDVSDTFSLNKQTGACVGFVARVCYGSSNVTNAQLERYVINYADIFQELVDYAPTCVRNFTNTPVKVAAVANVLLGADKEYVFDLYRNLSIQNLGCIPPIGLAFISQVNRGKAKALSGAGQNEVLGKCMLVFDPAKKNLDRIIIKDNSIYLNKVKKAFTLL